jgi:hypothetical protein
MLGSNNIGSEVSILIKETRMTKSALSLGGVIVFQRGFRWPGIEAGAPSLLRVDFEQERRLLMTAAHRD